MSCKWPTYGNIAPSAPAPPSRVNSLLNATRHCTSGRNRHCKSGRTWHCMSEWEDPTLHEWEEPTLHKWEDPALHEWEEQTLHKWKDPALHEWEDSALHMSRRNRYCMSGRTLHCTSRRTLCCMSGRTAATLAGIHILKFWKPENKEPAYFRCEQIFIYLLRATGSRSRPTRLINSWVACSCRQVGVQARECPSLPDKLTLNT